MAVLEPTTRSAKLVMLNDCFIMLIDIQEVFLKKGLSKSDMQIFISKIKHLIRLAEVLEIPMIITVEDLKNNGSIPKEISVMLPSDFLIYDKFIYSCWGQEDIQNAIKKIDRNVAVVCGLETDICVCQTSLDLLSNNYRVVILSDITYSRNQNEHDIGLKRMENNGAIISLLKTWQEEITAGIKTRINLKLRKHNLSDIP
ncbi:MAG: isochorismatase family protein [Candidatus Hodarchaeales archaeon]|jgi:nicotinamidase-related amidase